MGDKNMKWERFFSQEANTSQLQYKLDLVDRWENLSE
jgi:hypothetical protein